MVKSTWFVRYSANAIQGRHLYDVSLWGISKVNFLHANEKRSIMPIQGALPYTP